MPAAATADTARDHTRVLLEQVDEAARQLRYFEGRCQNGFGELFDPSHARGQLRDAQRAIEQALAAFTAAEKAGWSKEDF